MFNSKNGVGMYKTGLTPGVVQRSLCLQYCYCLTDARWNTKWQWVSIRSHL